MGQGNSRSGVIGWGSNEFSQLGSSNKSRCPRIIETLARGTAAVAAVGAAATYSAVLLDSGELLTFGKGDSGQLGQGLGEHMASVPRTVRGPLHGKIIKAVSCGQHHCAVITETGALYTWGRGQHGRLGHGIIEDEPTPRLVEALLGVVVLAVSCGEFHTLVSTSNGIYAFGLGLSGRLGLGNEEDQLVPVLVPGPVSAKPVISIAAGGHHSAAIVQPGVLYTWGGSSFGKLGHGDTSPCLLTPKLVSSLSHLRLASVCLGQQHSAALAATGDVFVCGKSQGERCEDLSFFERISDFPNGSVSSICAGKNLVCAVTYSGDVFVRGQFGPDLHSSVAGFNPASESTGETNRQQLYTLSGKGVVGIAMGELHAVAMADPARVLASSCLSTSCVADPSSAVEDGSNGGNSTPKNRPSLFNILESVVKAAPPVPPSPSAENEICFLSEELKLVQTQNLKLSVRLEEAIARISHLERENASLREELDSSLQCLPVDRIHIVPSTMMNAVDACTSPPPRRDRPLLSP